MSKKSSYSPWKGYLLLVVVGAAFIIGIFQWLNKGEEIVQDIQIILSEETCIDSGGIWNECGSSCRGQDSDTCIQVCVEQCECTKESDCPFGYQCVNPLNGIGICKKSS